MVRLQGTRIHLECPACDGDVVYREPPRLMGSIKTYRITCPDCSAALTVTSGQYESPLVSAPVVVLFYLMLRSVAFGRGPLALGLLLGVALLALLVLAAFLRTYDVQPEGSPFAGETLAAAADPGLQLLRAFQGLWRIVTARGGWPSSLGRVLLATGLVLSVAGFSTSHYLGASSTTGWLLEWVGLVLLLRSYSVIISFGGGFLLSALLLLAGEAAGALARLLVQR